VIDGLVLGGISFASMLFTWKNLPTWFKDWCLRHPVAAESISTLTAFLALTNVSSSLVAVFAAAFYGLLANLAMMAYQSTYGAKRVG
jgi:hypothetical protein